MLYVVFILEHVNKIFGTLKGAPGTGPGPGGTWPAGTGPGPGGSWPAGTGPGNVKRKC